MDFPKWKYHRTEPARTVETEDEDRALGDEWADTPFPKAEVEPGQNVGATMSPEDHRESFTKWLSDEDLADQEPGVLNLLFNAFTARSRQGAVEQFVAEEPTGDAEAERQKLLAEAKSLGLDLHHRTGAEKIQAAIDAKLAEE